MLNRNQWIAVIIGLVFTFTAGRYSVKFSTKDQKQTAAEVKKESSKETNTDKDQKVDSTTTTTKLPDGTVTVVNHTVKETQTNQQTNQDSKTDATKTTSETKEVTASKDGLAINGLIGVDITKPTAGYTGGIMVTVPFIFSSNIGVWGLTNTTVGFTLGFHL